MVKQWKQSQTIFLGSKIIVDSDCSHEIKRCLLLGRKAMTKLVSVLKSRDITFLTKVHVVKAMVFPVVMYGCESWTIKKAEHWRSDAFELVLEKTPESLLDWKEIKLVNLKGYQPWMFIGRTDAEALIIWPLEAKSWLIGKDPDARKGRRQEEKGMAKNELVGWYHRLNGCQLEQGLGDSEGQGSLACCRSRGCKELDTAEWLLLLLFLLSPTLSHPLNILTFSSSEMLKRRIILDLGATGWRFLVKGTLTHDGNTDGLLLNAISDGYLLGSAINTNNDYFANII